MQRMPTWRLWMAPGGSAASARAPGGPNIHSARPGGILDRLVGLLLSPSSRGNSGTPHSGCWARLASHTKRAGMLDRMWDAVVPGFPRCH